MPRKSSNDTDNLERRLIAFSVAARDPIPNSPRVLREIVRALLDRITKKDKKTGDWCRLIVQGLAGRERYEQDWALLNVPDACPEMDELRSGKPHAPGHIAPIVRKQNAILKRFLRCFFYEPIDELPKNISIAERFKFHEQRILEDLKTCPCRCRYPRSLSVQIHERMKEPEIRLEILAALHKVEASTINSLLKPARPNTPLPGYLR